MSAAGEQITHVHHFVPQWYQRRFLPEGKGEFYVLDKDPLRKVICPDGKARPIAKPREVFRSGTGALFQQQDLYAVNLPLVRPDHLERELFGKIDHDGEPANSLFSAWPETMGIVSQNLDKIPTNFGSPNQRMGDLINYIDAQKTRTPKGLLQIKNVFAARGNTAPTNNQVMSYMVSRRQRNFVVWAEAVWEIFAAAAGARFLLSDDPVVIYNCDCFPASPPCRFPQDPDPFWRGSRVLHPLGPGKLLVLTHVEHMDVPRRSKARRPRRNARSYDSVMLHFGHIVNDRELNAESVSLVNAIIKSRATRYVASSEEADLFPERALKVPLWCDLDRMFEAKYKSLRGSSETYIRYKDGSIYHNNAFGEHDTTPGWFVKKMERERKIAPEAE